MITFNRWYGPIITKRKCFHPTPWYGQLNRPPRVLIRVIIQRSLHMDCRFQARKIPIEKGPTFPTPMVWIADTVERLMSDIGVFNINLRNLIKTLLLVFVLPDKKTLVDCAVSIDFKLIVRVIKCQE